MTTVKHLTSDRVRRTGEPLVAGDPATAVIDTAGNDPTNLIVVGSRGLGAAEGEMLGAIAAAVVKDAQCDVLIVAGKQEWRQNADVTTASRPDAGLRSLWATQPRSLPAAEI